jgi:hypothetical protein
MTSIEVPIVTVRPAALTEVGAAGSIVEAADYYLNLLISHSPAEITCEYGDDPKFSTWCIRSLPSKTVVYTETIRSAHHRQILARIAASYMENSLYGGFQRLNLRHNGRTHRAVFYLGNDGFCGHWFKGICSDGEDEAQNL